MYLEQRRLAPGTINLRLGAVRLLAYEGVEHGLLSPDLAAGIRRVRGLKKLGVRLGNWLTAEQAQNLWQVPRDHGTKQARDRALLALLLSCGLRRHELVQLDLASVQQREDHWAIVDLEGKAGQMGTVPIPGWVKALLDEWLKVACIAEGRVFRRVNKAGRVSECAISDKAVWHVVRQYAAITGLGKIAPHDLGKILDALRARSLLLPTVTRQKRRVDTPRRYSPISFSTLAPVINTERPRSELRNEQRPAHH